MFFGRKLLCLPYAVLSLTSVLLAPCPATCRCLWSHSGFVLRLPTSLRGAGKSKSAGSQSADDNTHILAAPYYTVKGGFKATLMISNQGPNQLPVQVRLFNRSGVQFDLPALTLGAHEVRSLDLTGILPRTVWRVSGGSLQELRKHSSPSQIPAGHNSQSPCGQAGREEIIQIRLPRFFLSGLMRRGR